MEHFEIQYPKMFHLNDFQLKIHPLLQSLIIHLKVCPPFSFLQSFQSSEFRLSSLQSTHQTCPAIQSCFLQKNNLNQKNFPHFFPLHLPKFIRLWALEPPDLIIVHFSLVYQVFQPKS